MWSNFTLEESKAVGKKFKAICKANYGYEGMLTVGKEYEITIEERFLPMSPLCSFENDKGKLGSAHLTRFEKIGDK